MALLLMLCASASFATMSALVKAIGGDMPILQLVLIRCLLPLPFFVFLILSQKKSFIVKARVTVFLRSLFGFLAMVGFYYALTHMPLADCIFIGRSQPLFLALLAPFIVREKVPREAWFAIFTGLVGVFFIMNPAVTPLPLPGLVALASACFASFAHLMVRRLNRTDDPDVIVFNFFVLTALFSLLGSRNHFVLFSFDQLVLVSGVAFFATVGQFLMTLAYRYDRAPVVASASYASVILSVVYGYFFWNEIPDIHVFFGASLILCGGFSLFRCRFHVRESA